MTYEQAEAEVRAEKQRANERAIEREAQRKLGADRAREHKREQEANRQKLSDDRVRERNAQALKKCRKLYGSEIAGQLDMGRSYWLLKVDLPDRSKGQVAYTSADKAGVGEREAWQAGCFASLGQPAVRGHELPADAERLVGVDLTYAQLRELLGKYKRP